MDHYSLDVVIAVGYRVRSARGTQFRQWATNTLREYLTKGFAIDDERLMAGRVSADMARQHAEQEFAKHEAALRIREATEPTSDFDKAVEQIKKLERQPPAAKRPAAKPSRKAAKKKRGRRRGEDQP